VGNNNEEIGDDELRLMEGKQGHRQVKVDTNTSKVIIRVGGMAVG